MVGASDNSIVTLAEVKGDNRLLTPHQLVSEVLADIESGHLQCNSIIVIPLQRVNGQWLQTWYASNMSASCMLAVAAILQKNALGQMGF